MRRLSALLLFVCLISVEMSAQNGYRKFDNFIRKIMTTGLDSAFVAMSPTSWEIPACAGAHGQNFMITTKEGIEIGNNSGNVCEYGIGLGYHGLDFIWKKQFGNNENNFTNWFEFNFYDNYWGFQMITTRKESYGMNITSGTYGGYIAFNGNKFSYPAAIYGNYLQKESSGSPMLFFWYDRNRAWIDGMSSPVNANNFSVCGGYGYNLVFGDGRTIINFTGAVGLIAPYWGVSGQIRCSFIHWFDDYVRINASAVQYASAGWKNSAERLLSTEWVANVGLTFCFWK